MKIHREFQQNSLQWLQARCGIPTASEFDCLVTPEFKVRTGDMPKSFLARKIAESWQGYPLPGFQVLDMELGKVLEDEAIPFYELEFSEKVDRVGFVTTDDGKVGCSPDGLIAEGGIEIKCPRADTHVGYLLKSELPKDYAAQVHGSMYVTGAPWWKFMSYRRGFPPLVLTVFRDEKIQEQLRIALSLFLTDFDAAIKRLEEMNGGPAIKPKTILGPPTSGSLQDPDDYRM